MSIEKIYEPSKEDFLQLLVSDDGKVQQAAVAALVALRESDPGNIAKLADAGAVPYAMEPLNSSQGSMQAQACTLVKTLAGHPALHVQLEDAGVSYVLVKRLKSESHVRAAAPWAIASLADEASCALAFVEAGTAPALIGLLGSKMSGERVAAARAVQHIAAGSAPCAVALQMPGWSLHYRSCSTPFLIWFKMQVSLQSAAWRLAKFAPGHLQGLGLLMGSSAFCNPAMRER